MCIYLFLQWRKTKWRPHRVTWQFLQGAVPHGTHKHSSPDLCERAEWFFFHRTQIYFYENAMPLLLPLFPPPPFISTLLKMIFPFLLFSYHPNTLGLPWAPFLSSLTGSRLWWAVVLLQAPQAGKLCQSESLCCLITAVRSKPKLAIHEVTFILFPTLFLCPWLPELRYFSLLPALLGSKNRLSEVVTKTVWIQVTAKDLHYLQLSIF